MTIGRAAIDPSVAMIHSGLRWRTVVTCGLRVMAQHASLLAFLLIASWWPVQASEQLMPPITVPNRAALLALDTQRLSDSSIAFVAGYRTPADGGGGTYVWRDVSTELADGIIILAPTSSKHGRWIREGWNGEATPEMAGAVGDGTTDDVTAFSRLVSASLVRGAFTVTLTPGKRYYIASLLDLSVGAPGLVVAGPSSPRYDVPSGRMTAPVTRIELDPATGATVKLGSGQVLRDLLIWRHGLTETPHSLQEVRTQVATWFTEDGTTKPLSLSVDAPFDDAVIEGCRIVGFHTGIRATGGRFTLINDQIDTAGYAVEVSGSKATSLIQNLAAGALWSRPVLGRDSLGDSGYRPGTAYYIHDSADGLQINSVGAEDWVTGMWFAGSRQSTDWMISLLQPDIETPPNGGNWTAAIRTTGEIRRLTIVDPRIVSGGLGNGPSAALDFGHSTGDDTSSENNNVTVIGGSLEAASKSGVAVLIRPGATGMLIGVTLNLAIGDQNGPLVRVLAGAGDWLIANADIRGKHNQKWIEIDPSVGQRVRVVGSRMSSGGTP
jgi:hypothetical protein